MRRTTLVLTAAAALFLPAGASASTITYTDASQMCELAGWASAARHTAPILLLTVITCSPTGAQGFDHNPQTVALAPSSSGVPVPSREALLPANLIVPDVVRPLVTSMWWQSPTFRRQCARLAEYPDVIVHIELAVRVRDGWARSRLERHPGGGNAAVLIELRAPARYVESIAHELEHVLEQVDGTDLPRLARQAVDGVVRSGGQYETARAQWVGRRVAREVMTP
jgi:hypothetical protein